MAQSNDDFKLMNAVYGVQGAANMAAGQMVILGQQYIANDLYSKGHYETDQYGHSIWVDASGQRHEMGLGLQQLPPPPAVSKEDIDRLDNRINGVSRDLEDDIDTLSDRLDTERNQRGGLEGAVALLETDVRTQRAIITDLSNRVSQLDDMVDALMQENEKMRNSMKILIEANNAAYQKGYQKGYGEAQEEMYRGKQWGQMDVGDQYANDAERDAIIRKIHEERIRQDHAQRYGYVHKGLDVHRKAELEAFDRRHQEKKNGLLGKVKDIAKKQEANFKRKMARA